MHFKLIIALIEDSKTNAVLEAARSAGATGSTVINQARGLREDVVTEENQREHFQKITSNVENGLYLVPKVLD